MAKKQFTLTTKSLTPLARNKRLRQVGIYGSVYVSSNGSSSSSGGTVTGIELVIVGDGNAVTTASLSSDKTTLTLSKDLTFLDAEAIIECFTEFLAQIDNRFLRKDKDDSTIYSISVGGTLTVGIDGVEGGNLVVKGDGDVAGNFTIGKDLDVNGETTSKGVINAKDGVKFGEYVQGLLGSGGYIDAQGNGELGGLTLRNFLEVPELRFNRVSVIAGTQWQTAGQGLIEEVTITDDLHGHCKLHLDEGEYGAIEEGDLCFGVFHNFEDTSQNYTGDDDDSQTGDFLFKGFCSVYFRITSVNDTKSEFDYELRNDGSWQYFNHPQSQMTFAGYGNVNVDRTERQKCIYSTLTYTLFCESVTTWNFGKENIYMILGKLDGFEVQNTSLSGDGAYLRNAYISGALVQIENMPFVMTFSDTLAWVVNVGETDTITCKISKLTQDVTDEFGSWTAKIEGGGNLTISDSGVITATYDELFGSSDSVMVDVTATHTDSGEVVNDSFAVRKFDESRDGLTIIQSADSVTFNADNNSYDFSIEVLRGNVHDAITSYSISGVPDGVSYMPVQNLNGVLSFTLTRSDTSVNISGKITISITVDSVTYTRYLYLLTAVDGEGAVYIEAPDLVWTLSGDTELYFEVYAFKGNEPYQLTPSNIKATSNNSNVIIELTHPYDYGYQLVASFSRDLRRAKTALNSTATITVTIDGVAYTKTINLTAVYDGDDAIQLSSTSEVLVWKTSSDVDRYFFLQLRQGNELIEFSSSDINIKSKPTGVAIVLVGYFAESGFEIEATFTGVLSNTELDDLLEFEVTSNNVTYTKQIRCVAVYDGQDAAGIAIDIPMQDIAIKGTCNQDIDCRIYVNNEIYPITRSAIKVDDSQISGPFGFTCEGVFDGMIQFNYYCMVYGGSYPLDAIIPVTFTVNGIDFVRNFHMYTVFDGEASAKGADAVVYELDCSVSTIHYQAAAGAFAPSSVTCSLYKVTANYKESYSERIEVDVMYVGSTTWANIYSDNTTSVTFTPEQRANGYPSQYRITATTPQGDIEKIITVTNSCAIRVQNWEDIEDEGFNFESGQIGETFYDFVVYNNGGTLFYYQCIKSHTKFEGEEVTNTEYWKSVNSFDAVATNLLLAGTAKIDNLYVDDVYMANDNTAIWVNPALDGMKINKFSNLGSDTSREGQSSTSDIWKNPTTWFHGGDIEETASLFGGDTSEVISDSFSAKYLPTNTDTSSYISIDYHQYDLKANTSYLIKVGGFDLTKASSGPYAFYGDLELRLYYESGSSTSGNYMVLAHLSLGLFSSTASVGSYSAGFTIGSNTDIRIAVYCRYNDRYENDGHYSQITYRIYESPASYISQYAANGFFIGANAMEFIRSTIKANSTSHELFAKEHGIQITPNGSFQYSGYNPVPFGSILLSGYLAPNDDDSMLVCKIWTWDGQSPTIEYQSAGKINIVYGSLGWASKLGLSGFDETDLATIVNVRNPNVGAYRVVANIITQNSNYVNIEITETSSYTARSLPIHVAIFFVGGGRLISVQNQQS